MKYSLGRGGVVTPIHAHVANFMLEGFSRNFQIKF